MSFFFSLKLVLTEKLLNSTHKSWPYLLGFKKIPDALHLAQNEKVSVAGVTFLAKMLGE
jgi:hypothetical protein